MPKPSTIGELVPKVVHRAAQRRAALQRLRREWTRLVGKSLALHARPASLRRGTLYVHTDEPGTNFVLQLERPRLLAKLQARAKPPIKEIVIRAGELDGVSD